MLKRYHWLLPYLKPYKYHLLIVMFLSLLSTSLTLSYPFFSSLLIDGVLLERAYSLPSIVGLAFGAMLVGYILSSLNSLLYLHTTLQMLRNLRYQLFLRVQRTNYSFFVHRRVGDIINRLNGDAAEVQGGLTDTVLQGIIQISTFLFVSGMLFYLDYKLAISCFLFLPILILSMRYFRPLIIEISRNLREQHSTLQSFLIERLNGIKLIKFACAEERVAKEFDCTVEGINKKSFRYSWLSTVAEGIPRIAILISSMIIFSWGGYLVLTDQMTIGALVAFTGYQARLFGPVQSIAAMYMRLQRMNVSLDRLEELFQATEEEYHSSKKEMKPSTRLNDELLQLDDVSFGYQKQPLIKHVSISIKKGEKVALVGASGKGKSTIIDLISGLYIPTSGTIHFLGQEISGIPLAELRHQIAVASQQPVLFNGTILENLTFAVPNAKFTDVKAVAKVVGIHDEIMKMKDGYKTVMGERGIALSGGQRQRVALARTLLQPALLYIFDEATSEIDERSERNLYKRLQEFKPSSSMIFISHRITTLSWVDQIWHLSEKRLIREEEGFGQSKFS